MDYPFTNVDFVHHKSFVTWRQNKNNGHRGMFISHIPVGTMYSGNCPKIDQKDIEDINFTFDLSGNLHLVYANVTDSTIEHEMFDPISNQFA